MANRISVYALTSDEQERLNNMLNYFGEKGYTVRLTLLRRNNKGDLVELINDSGNVIASGEGLILDDAISSLIETLNKVGFF